MSERTLASPQKQGLTRATQPISGFLQRKCACGNHTMGGGECAECSKTKLGLQRKLTIGASNDPLEQEADRVADQVLAGSAHPPAGHTSTRIQRYAGPSGGGREAAPASVEHVLASPGTPLQPALRQDMEQRFGYDFSRVRVHTGSAAEQSARGVNALAYTVGRDVVFGAGQFAPGDSVGRRLIAHELTHVVQQSGSDGSHSGQSGEKHGVSPITHEQDPLPSRQVIPARPEGRSELSRVSVSTTLELQRMVGNRFVTGLLQRQETSAPPGPATAPPGPAAAPSGQPMGDAVKPEVESLLKTFASASAYEAKNAAAMQAVRAIIRAYSMSTKGLSTMRFRPDLNPKHGAETGEVEGNPRASEIEFGPSSFTQGFEWLVHMVAHELEHVRQNLIGGYHRGDVDEPVSEFLAYVSSVLQVQIVAAPAGKGFLGAQIAAQKTGSGQSAPALPPLPPDGLAFEAEKALAEFSKMPSAEQKKPQYRQELATARDKLFDRLKNEAPRPLRPPTRFTPEWSRWYEGQASTADPFTIEYQDWLDSLKSPWARVKAIWKQFDAAIRVH